MPGVESRCCEPNHPPRGDKLSRHVRELELRILELPNGASESFPLLHIAQRRIEGGLGRPDRGRRY